MEQVVVAASAMEAGHAALQEAAVQQQEQVAAAQSLLQEMVEQLVSAAAATAAARAAAVAGSSSSPGRAGASAAADGGGGGGGEGEGAAVIPSAFEKLMDVGRLKAEVRVLQHKVTQLEKERAVTEAKRRGLELELDELRRRGKDAEQVQGLREELRGFQKQAAAKEAEQQERMKKEKEKAAAAAAIALETERLRSVAAENRLSAVIAERDMWRTRYLNGLQTVTDAMQWEECSNAMVLAGGRVFKPEPQ
jgi:hypothetical protein